MTFSGWGFTFTRACHTPAPSEFMGITEVSGWRALKKREQINSMKGLVKMKERGRTCMNNCALSTLE
jgi:hypothetical protein